MSSALDYGADLLPQHAALLAASGTTPEIARAGGYRSVTNRSALKHIRFTDRQAIAPALLIPVHGVTSSVVTYQHRPDEPRIVDGKPLKYETPAGSKMALDVPPTVRQWLGNPSRPLFITEGVRKADAAASADLCCIALLDVWNWRGTNDQGGKVALADWESIALNEREVYIVFDSDVMTKPSVSAALERLKAFLEQRDARVRVIYLPSGDCGVKQGLDDFLASGKTVDDLIASEWPAIGTT